MNKFAMVSSTLRTSTRIGACQWIVSSKVQRGNVLYRITKENGVYVLSWNVRFQHHIVRSTHENFMQAIAAIVDTELTLTVAAKTVEPISKTISKTVVGFFKRVVKSARDMIAPAPTEQAIRNIHHHHHHQRG